MLLDVTRAHFHPPIQRKLFVELPLEDREEGADFVGELERTMYGTRDASASWERFYTEVFELSGVSSGDFCPCLFCNQTSGVQAWVHGHDKALLGTRQEVLALEKLLGEKMLLKRTALLGFADGDDRTDRLLNRIIELKVVDGVPVLDFEPDPRHVQIALADLGLQGKVKPVSSPCAAEEGNLDETPL